MVCLPRAAAHDARDVRHVAAAVAGQDGDLRAERARRARGHLQRRLAQEAGEPSESLGLTPPQQRPLGSELLTHPGGHEQFAGDSVSVGSSPCAYVVHLRRASAQSCLERIWERFGPGTAFCAVGDGAEERDAAAALGWPFIHVGMAPARGSPDGNPSASGSPGATPSADAQGPGGCALTALTAEAVVRRALSGCASAPPARITRPRADPRQDEPASPGAEP